MKKEAGAPRLRIARIAKPHGVKGAVQVETLTDFLDRFRPDQRVDVNGKLMTIRSVSALPGGLVLHFDGIDDREAAEAMRGAYVTLPLDQARPLPDDRFYHFQLVGLRVVNARSRRTLGTVSEVLDYPANDVLRITGEMGELLVPMLKAVVREVDPAAGLILVELPDDSPE